MLKKVRFTHLLASAALVLVLLHAVSHAQPTFNWESLGPTDLGGSIRALAYSPDGSKIYAGAPGGGLWVSTNGGRSWTPVAGFSGETDQNLAVTSIAFDAVDGTMYVATGATFLDTDHRITGQTPYVSLNTGKKGYTGYAGMFGGGIFVSTNGGQSFTVAAATIPTTSFSTSDAFTSINVVKARNGKLFFGTDKGLYVSENRGQTATRVSESYAIPPTTGTELASADIYDIEITADGKVLVGATQYLFISTNEGNTFTEYIGLENLPRNSDDPTAAIRTSIAVSRNNTNRMYLCMVGGGGNFLVGVWQSSNGGDSWTRIAPRSTATGTTIGTFAPLAYFVESRPDVNVAGRGLQALIFEVDAANDDRIFLGGQLWYWWDSINGWTNETRTVPEVQADNRYVPEGIQAFVQDPNNPATILLGTTKELVKSTDGGRRFQISNGNLSVSQVYDVAVGGDGTVLASTRGHGIISNSGRANSESGAVTSWRVHSPASPRRGSVAISRFKPDYMISGANNTFFRSLDGGNVFTNSDWIPTPNPAFAVYPLDTVGSLIFRPSLVPPNPPVIIDEVDTIGTGIAQDSLENVVNRVYAFLGSRDRVWLGRFPFNPVDSEQDRPSLNSIFRFSSSTDEISALAITGDATHTLFIGTTNGFVYRIVHAENKNHPNFSTTTILDPTTGINAHVPDRWITSLRLHPRYKDTLIVTFGTYRTDNPSSPACSECGYVYATPNALSSNTPTFYNQSNAFSELGFYPVYDALFDPDPTLSTGDQSWLALGTERGVYTIVENDLNFSSITSGSGVDWREANDGYMDQVPVHRFAYSGYQLISKNYPNSSKTFLVSDTARYKRQIYAATWGRGVAVSRILSGPVSRGSQLSRNDGSFRLRIYPNPAQDYTHLALDLKQPATARLQVLNLNGQEVYSQDFGQLATGTHELDVAAGKLPSGLYLFKTTLSSASDTLYDVQRVAIQR
ncbi:MAG: T9SS type A sorting domain-containing protein [Sphingobacteriia bacterium]